MSFNPYEIAVLYYFGDLSYWTLPQVAADALEQGFDGSSLRKLAGCKNHVASDIRPDEIDSAFSDMGVAAPITKHDARLFLAVESSKKALRGETSVFDAATHIRIHLCELKQPPPELHRIVTLSKEADGAPRDKWNRLESELRTSLSEFVSSRE